MFMGGCINVHILFAKASNISNMRDSCGSLLASILANSHWKPEWMATWNHLSAVWKANAFEITAQLASFLQETAGDK